MARKKSDELWSTNQRVYLSDFDPPKVNFVGYQISAPRGRCWLKFLHALENDQGFLAHPVGDGGPPPNNFQQQTFKNWLKIRRISRNNSGARESNLTKLFHVTCCEGGMITWVQFLGGLPPLEFGIAKTVQNLVRFCATSHFDRTYLRNESGYRQADNGVFNYHPSHV